MLFLKEKLAQAISDSGLRREWLCERLCCTAAVFDEIVNGTRRAGYRLSKELLQVLGYGAVVEAIDWAHMSVSKAAACGGAYAR